MNAGGQPLPQPVTTEEFKQSLQSAISAATGQRREIRLLVQRASQYRSSFPLDELTVSFNDGQQLELVFKNVDPRVLSSAARRAKPAFLDDPQREIEVYRTILADEALGTAKYYGSIVNAETGQFWLFLERVAGRELYQLGEVADWTKTARWLARFHQRFALPDTLPQPVLRRLVRFDASYYRQWFDRAWSFLKLRTNGGSCRRSATLQRLVEHAPAIIGELLTLPHSFIHGEFYASNILIGPPGMERVCPIDWERAAVGPGLMDVAALIAGRWPETQKRDMALEYREELLKLGGATPSAQAFLRGVNLCRLHIAVQWLGWSADWSPPPEHRYDWFVDAVELAGKLGYAV